MTPINAFALVSLATLLAIACSSSDDSGAAAPDCAPVGSQTLCNCPSGTQGQQTCRNDGTLGPCDCGTGPVGAGGAGDPRASCDQCSAEQVCVGGDCVDVPNECPCPAETYCDLAAARCVIGCTTDEHCDTGRICLVDTRTCLTGCRDDASCAAGQICEDTACIPGCRDDAGCGPDEVCENLTCVGCTDDSSCGPGEICEAQACVAGCRDDAGCAGIAGTRCVNGACQCDGGGSPCGTACVDLNTDPNNCGSCGTVCGSVATSCTGGVCVCPGGGTACGDVCIDASADRNNCGGCGVSCGPGSLSTCAGGGCINGAVPDDTLGPYAACTVQCVDQSLICIQGPNIWGTCGATCTVDSDCPPSPGGYARPICPLGYCVLSCDAALEVPGVPACPTGLECITGGCLPVR